jgi:secondary thiamine-phosphate synthase enzyme
MRQTVVTVETRAAREVVNVTEPVAAAVSGLGDGVVVLHVPHTTAALLIGEDDPELRRDLLKVAGRWLEGLRPFEHIRRDNPNSEAHIMSSVFGVNLTLTLEGGRLALGTYQNLILLEMDGPKRREIRLTFLPAR